MKQLRRFFRLTALLACGALLACTVPKAAGLANSHWQVTGVSDGKELVSTRESGVTMTLTFDGAGRASGQSGCNRFSEGYVESGNQLTFSQAAGTRMMCMQPQDIMQREAWMLAALGSVATWSAEGDVLVLRTATGATAFMLRRAATP